MGLFNFLNINKQPITETKKVNTTGISSFEMYRSTDSAIPVQKTGQKGYTKEVEPRLLAELYTQSPLHSSIINFKKLLTSGQGYSVNDDNLDMTNKISLNQLTNQFDSMLNEISMDLFIYNTIAIEVTWNKDNTKIIKLERIEPNKLNISELNDKMQPLSFIYNFDWDFPSKYTTKHYPAFDVHNKKDKVQLYYYQVETPGMKIYTVPSYSSAINWIKIDKSMADYHTANIDNSLNPGMLIQFPYSPESAEEKTKILQDINQSFAGAKKAGRAMINFGADKESLPIITQLEPNKLDKTFVALTDTIQRQVCYAHGLDPQLLGLKTPGSLGNSGDFMYSFNLFNSSVIQPSQIIIENILNKFISTNGILSKIKLNEPDITKLLPTTK